MAKTKQKDLEVAPSENTEASEVAKELIFTCGGNLADGTRFEEGDVVPADVSEKELKVLREMGAIGESE